MPDPFLINDCALAVIATGESATNLVHLKEILYRIPLNSIYYHFWGSRLRASFTHPDYHNDFAYWTHFSLHDNILSERLGIIDPTEYEKLEDLRQALLEIIEERLDEIEFSTWSKNEHRFHFLEAAIIVFETPTIVMHPNELKSVIPLMPLSSIFYHFIDARMRTPERIDDFSIWLRSFGDSYEPLVKKIQLIDPYFSDLSTIRQKLEQIVLNL